MTEKIIILLLELALHTKQTLGLLSKARTNLDFKLHSGFFFQRKMFFMIVKTFTMWLQCTSSLKNERELNLTQVKSLTKQSYT